MSPSDLLRLLLHDFGAVAPDDRAWRDGGDIAARALRAVRRLSQRAEPAARRRGAGHRRSARHARASLVDQLNRLAALEVDGEKALQVVLAAHPVGGEPASARRRGSSIARRRRAPHCCRSAATSAPRTSTHRLTIAGGAAVTFSSRAIDLLFGLVRAASRGSSICCASAPCRKAPRSSRARIEPASIEAAASALGAAARAAASASAGSTSAFRKRVRRRRIERGRQIPARYTEPMSEQPRCFPRDRRTAPRRSRVSSARVIPRAGQRSRRARLRGSRARSGSVLGELCARARVVAALDHGARVETAARQVVCRRQDQRERQLPRPSPARAARRNKAAIIWEGEPGDRRTLTYFDLHREVCQFANVLKSLGIARGDRVAIYLPLIPELAIAMLACARIGAVHSVVFGGFSAESLRDRINDAQARLLDHRRRRLSPRQRRPAQEDRRRSAGRHAVDRARRSSCAAGYARHSGAPCSRDATTGITS